MNMSDVNSKGPAEIKIGVRGVTKAKFDAFAARRRMKLVEVADLAIDALNLLPREQQEALLERRDSRMSQQVA